MTSPDSSGAGHEHTRARTEPDARPGHWLAGLSEPTRALGTLFEAQRHHASHQAQRLGMGVTDMRALGLLDARGPLGVTELARLLELRPASVTSLVDRLEVAGVLERVRDPTDRRRVVVRALPGALDRSYAVWEPAIRAMDGVGRALGPEHRRVVIDYLDAVAATMAADVSASATATATATATGATGPGTGAPGGATAGRPPAG